MKTKLKKRVLSRAVVLLIVASCITLSVIPAMAGPSRHTKGMGGPKHHRTPLGIWRNPQLIQELGLIEDQVTKLREADFAAREKHLKLKTQLDGSRLQMDRAFSQKAVDDEVVRQLAEKIANIKGRLFVNNVESRLTMVKILNTDQIDKLKLYKMGQRAKKTHQGKRPISGDPSLEQPKAQTLSAAVSD